MIYSCPINKLSYGYVGYYFLKGMVDNGLVPRFIPMGQVDLEDVSYLKYIQNEVKQTLYNDVSLLLYHEFDLLRNNLSNFNIGFPIFEMNNLKYCAKHIESQQAIFVASEWARNVILDTTLQNRAYVVPLGFDPDIFYPKNWNEGPLKFFNIGKWEYRKGHDIILKAFNRAFSSNHNVELHMLSNLQFSNMSNLNDKWTTLYKNSKLGDKIHIHKTLPNHSDIASFINSNHVGVFLSRAEGWNMGLLESLACGRTCIATYNTGQTEYLDDYDSVYKIYNNITENAIDGVWFDGSKNSSWAHFTEGDIDEVVEIMRLLYKQYKDGYLTMAEPLSQKYTWENAQNIFNKLISSLV